MLVILICIHRLECGRHPLSSDLFSTSRSTYTQPYSTIVTFSPPPHIFYIENAFMAKNSHKRQKAPNKDISVSRILSKFQCHVGGNVPPLGFDKKCYQSLSWLTQVAQVLMCGFAFK